jgi:hypothetical protein
MPLHHGIDASVAPKSPYPNTDFVAGYIGGNTPHVWTLDEWNTANGAGKLRSLPIWVGYLEDDPLGHAVDAAKKAMSLGWKAYLHRYIALDKETQEDRKWVLTFAAKLTNLGFLTIEYRSLDPILQDPTPPAIDNWVADWIRHPDLSLVPREEMMQYDHDIPFGNTVVDLDVATDTAFNNMGRGLRRNVTIP